ncbi:J domain-containing protein [Paenibacillus sp. F411]|uniref:Heat shock protein DnaJ domain protein n=1 Tax=Paenibacillus algicola TaxID=2565926 RepID=A0A4P8XPL9_9BACL|nr:MULTISPECIES: J domain-containing protein [Paenibacillus]MBO2943661.1 J domain-containing protein [Paenibacillus sp. F411]QCT03730.1 heat shock protein DnaJ domain protein [Paenibacillus algicola]
MDQMKEAYEKLGLPETASREEVEERYTLLMRQARSEQRRSPEKAEAVEARFSEATRAYRYITEEDDRKSLEEISRQKYGKFRGLAGPAEKTEHFFRYYRYHVLGALALLGLAIYIVISIVNYRAEQERLAQLPPVDLSIMLLGTYMMPDGGTETEPLEQAILEQFPEWKRVEVNMTYVPPLNSSNPSDAALLQKALLMISSERPDLYIVDQNSYEWVGNQGIFQPLDEKINQDWKDIADPGLHIKGQLDEDPAERVYAVNITDSSLVEGLPVAKNEMYAGISPVAENEQKAFAFIQAYLEAVPSQ